MMRVPNVCYAWENSETNIIHEDEFWWFIFFLHCQFITLAIKVLLELISAETTIEAKKLLMQILALVFFFKSIKKSNVVSTII